MNISNNLEQEKVHNIYNIISKHFSTTRKIIWPKVEDFIDSFHSKSLILDIGCGNGKNMGSREDCIYIGLDACENLMKQAKLRQNCSYIVGNCIHLPFNLIHLIMHVYCCYSSFINRIHVDYKQFKEINRILKIGVRGINLCMGL